MRRRSLRRRVAGILARLAAALLAVALAAVAAELLLPVPPGLAGAIWRQARGSLEEYEPGRLRTVAHFVGEQTVGGGRQHVRHDALGMRGPDLPPKRAGERRVLFLGDSVTYGTGVQEEDTFARQLEPLLAQEIGGEVRCGIAAAPGFGVRDQAPFLERVRDGFRPDLVVSCVFVENDLYDDLQLERGVFAGYPVFQTRQVHLLQRSLRARLAARFTLAYQLEQFLARTWPAIAMDVGGATLTPEEAALWSGVAPDQSLLFLEQVQPTPALARLVARSVNGLRALAAAAQPEPLVVVLLPSYVQFVPGLFEHLAAARTDEGEHRCGAIQERLRTACGDLGLPCFDLLPLLRARTDAAALLIPNDYHFTPLGHRVVAEALAPWLADRLPR
ncbi:MAG: SGNH/GDSL hydrolase family protein [Planctomycetota bacterium]